MPSTPPARSPSVILADARSLQSAHGPRLIVSALRRIARRLAD